MIEHQENKIISMIALLPRSKQLLIALLTLIGILCLGFIVQMTYHDSAMKSAKRQETRLKQELIKTTQFNDSYQNDQAKLRSLKTYLKNDTRRFMRLRDRQPIIQSISILAAENNLSVASVDPEQEKVDNQFVYIPIEIKLQGHFHDIARFISGLGQLRQIVSVENLIMKRAAEDSIDAEILFRAYQPVSAPIKGGSR